MWDTASSRLSWILRIAWGVTALICIVLMQLQPGEQAITLHVIWIGLALAHGFAGWRPIELAVMVAVMGAASGTILVRQAVYGLVDWSETAEVPLGAVLIAVVAWHMHRRHQALQELTALADDDRRRSASRQLLIQQVSHELRTPITIARGYTESLREEIADPALAEEAAIVLDELDKIAQIGERLVTLMQIEGPFLRQRIDLEAALTRIVRRWSPTAVRQWSVTATAGDVLINPDRLEVAVDCLLDNAVKFTGPGDHITVHGIISDQWWTIEITDSGRGMSAGDTEALNAAQPAAKHALSGTGLGLMMVRGIVGAWGGTIRVHSEPNAGTTVSLRFPSEHFGDVTAVLP
jgi:two-component system OmpR family sensor kinase